MAEPSPPAQEGRTRGRAVSLRHVDILANVTSTSEARNNDDTVRFLRQQISELEQERYARSIQQKEDSDAIHQRLTRVEVALEALVMDGAELTAKVAALLDITPQSVLTNDTIRNLILSIRPNLRQWRTSQCENPGCLKALPQQFAVCPFCGFTAPEPVHTPAAAQAAQAALLAARQASRSPTHYDPAARHALQHVGAAIGRAGSSSPSSPPVPRCTACSAFLRAARPMAVGEIISCHVCGRGNPLASDFYPASSSVADPLAPSPATSSSPATRSARPIAVPKATVDALAPMGFTQSDMLKAVAAGVGAGDIGGMAAWLAEHAPAAATCPTTTTTTTAPLATTHFPAAAVATAVDSHRRASVGSAGASSGVCTVPGTVVATASGTDTASGGGLAAQRRYARDSASDDESDTDGDGDAARVPPTAVGRGPSPAAGATAAGGAGGVAAIRASLPSAVAWDAACDDAAMIPIAPAERAAAQRVAGHAVTIQGSPPVISPQRIVPAPPTNATPQAAARASASPPPPILQAAAAAPSADQGRAPTTSPAAGSPGPAAPAPGGASPSAPTRAPAVPSTSPAGTDGSPASPTPSPTFAARSGAAGAHGGDADGAARAAAALPSKAAAEGGCVSACVSDEAGGWGIIATIAAAMAATAPAPSEVATEAAELGAAGVTAALRAVRLIVADPSNGPPAAARFMRLIEELYCAAPTGTLARRLTTDKWLERYQRLRLDTQAVDAGGVVGAAVARAYAKMGCEVGDE